ncbi:MAG: hypothetical protein RLZZ73_866, partial [Actinomycetota bacterium]
MRRYSSMVLAVALLFSSMSVLVPNVASAAAIGWQIQMQVTGKKSVPSGSRQTNLGSPGSSTF